GQPEVGWDIFGASVISRMHRVLCDLGFTFYYFRRGSMLLGRVPEVEAVLEVTNLESMLVNLPLIHLEFEELELDRRELDKQKVEQPEVDRFDLDEPGVGVDGTSLVGLRHPPASKHNFPQNRLSTGVGAEIDFSCQGVKAFNIPLNQQLSKKIPGGDGSARNPTLATNGAGGFFMAANISGDGWDGYYMAEDG
ncbi:hypothetical protein Tco_0025002, partial [Tanacetum coccineum]